MIEKLHKLEEVEKIQKCKYCGTVNAEHTVDCTANKFVENSLLIGEGMCAKIHIARANSETCMKVAKIGESLTNEYMIHEEAYNVRYLDEEKMNEFLAKNPRIKSKDDFVEIPRPMDKINSEKFIMEKVKGKNLWHKMLALYMESFSQEDKDRILICAQQYRINVVSTDSFDKIPEGILEQIMRDLFWGYDDKTLGRERQRVADFIFIERLKGDDERVKFLNKNHIRKLLYTLWLLDYIGIIHNDLTLKNIMIEDDNGVDESRIFLIDFGRSISYDPDDSYADKSGYSKDLTFVTVLKKIFLSEN